MPPSLNPWKSLGGSTRQFVNTETGERLSRRQYDKQFGALAKAGQRSYESKAKANRLANPELAKARPARGRPSQLATHKAKEKGSEYYRLFSRLRPIKGKHGRNSLYYKARNVFVPLSFSLDTADYENLTVLIDIDRGIKANSRIFGVSIDLVYTLKGVLKAVNIFPAYMPADIPDAIEIIETVSQWINDHENSKHLKVLGVSYHIIFKSSLVNKLNANITRN